MELYFTLDSDQVYISHTMLITYTSQTISEYSIKSSIIPWLLYIHQNRSEYSMIIHYHQNIHPGFPCGWLRNPAPRLVESL